MFSRYVFVLLALAGGCADSKAPIKYGETTKAALLSDKGQPVSAEKPLANSTTEILVYPDNQKYQVSNDVVVAGFREPSADEKSLLYWRHRFKDCPTTFEALNEPANHLHPEKELKCARDGVSVIYDPNTDQVTRVVEHAQN